MVCVTRNKSFVSFEVTSVIRVTEKPAEYHERGYASAVTFVTPALTLVDVFFSQGLRCWNMEQTAAWVPSVENHSDLEGVRWRMDFAFVS